MYNNECWSDTLAFTTTKNWKKNPPIFKKPLPCNPPYMNMQLLLTEGHRYVTSAAKPVLFFWSGLAPASGFLNPSGSSSRLNIFSSCCMNNYQCSKHQSSLNSYSIFRIVGSVFCLVVVVSSTAICLIILFGGQSKYLLQNPYFCALLESLSVNIKAKTH